MSRKIALVMASALCAVFVGSGCGPRGGAHSASAPRPNFVFVLTDDLAWNLVSHMPHVVALQKAGMTFSHYYVVDSLCCPSRSAIFTGEYPHDDGVFTNTGNDGGYKSYDAHGDQPKSFGVALQKSGYRTSLMGKYLNGYDPADPVAPGWDVWDAAGNGYGEFSYSLNQNGKQHSYGDAPDAYLTDVLSAKATSFIASSASSHKPFMLEVATFAPHAPYVSAPRYASAAANVQYPKNAAYDRLPVNPPTWLGQREPPTWLGQREPLTAAQQVRITGVYRKRVEADLSVDDMIGNIEGELRAKGVAKNTYVVFSSDNGFHMGEYRLAPGKQTAFEAVRTDIALYVAYDNGDQEYYDTATDPLELDNIASKGVPPGLRKALVALEDCHNGVTCWAAAHLH